MSPTESSDVPSRNGYLLRGAGVFTLAIVSLFFWDQPFSHFSQQEQFLMFRQISYYLTDVGLGWPYFSLSAGTFLLCHYRIRKLSAAGAEPALIAPLQTYKWWSGFAFTSLFWMGAVIHIFKFTLGRQRPHMSPIYAPDVFYPATFNWDFHSFPSGHSEVIFVVATVLALRFPRWRYWFLATATLIALTRVVLLQHFLSDVIMGAAIGYFGTQVWYQVLKTRPAAG